MSKYDSRNAGRYKKMEQDIENQLKKCDEIEKNNHFDFIYTTNINAKNVCCVHTKEFLLYPIKLISGQFFLLMSS